MGTPFLAKKKKMKWNGRSYRPAKAQFYTKKKPFDFEEALKPYGEKELPVWQSVVAVNVPPVIPPSPTPSVTASNTPTPTPSVTPGVTPTQTPSNTPSTTPSNTPSITPTNTPSITPTNTPSNTPTNTPSTTPSNTPSITPSRTPAETPTNTPTNTPSITPTNTPSNTPSVTPSVTPSITATNTPTPSITPSTSVIPSGTTEANLYLETVATAKGSALGSTISAATVTLFTSLVSNGLWDKLYAFYPMVGSTSSTCAINGKIPGEDSIVFNGGWTFNASGATPNGINAYGTTVNATLATAQNSSHISYYSVSSNQNSGLDMGAVIPSSPFPMVGLYVREDSGSNAVAGVRINASSSVYSTYTTGNTFNDGRAYIIGSRTTSTAQRLYFNGALKTTTTNTSVNRPNLNIYLGARNNNGTADAWGSKQCAFATIGSGLNDTEAGNLSTIINTFQTSLGRNVY